DGVADDMSVVAAGLIEFAGSDLLCYRALEPEGLVARQEAIWDPVLSWLSRDFGADFATAAGILHVEQPAAALSKFSAALDQLVAGDPFRLTALHTITTLTGSVFLAFAAGHGRMSTEDAWQAAHVDEDWQIAQWGEDEEAAQRRAARRKEMQAAVEVLALTTT
ncbi:MAG: ATPase, partial [Hyphomicrobiales bacterium]|nr:ATPase [Hyphomicrobiales bacterium]